MSTKDLSKYIVTEATEFLEEDADLDQADTTWPDGRALTEASAEDYTIARRRSGRPSLTGRAASSPAIALRVPPALRDRVSTLAAAEGRTVAAIARQALEEYVSAHESR